MFIAELAVSPSRCGRDVKTILVVEDNADSREYVALLLRMRGYEVHEAENGKDALDQLETMQTLPSLLLLDLMMPVMSGLELLRVLRERTPLARLPVVVLTAGGPTMQVPHVRKVLRKPTDPQLVLAVVHEICGAP